MSLLAAPAGTDQELIVGISVGESGSVWPPAKVSVLVSHEPRLRNAS